MALVAAVSLHAVALQTLDLSSLKPLAAATGHPPSAIHFRLLHGQTPAGSIHQPPVHPTEEGTRRLPSPATPALPSEFPAGPAHALQAASEEQIACPSSLSPDRPALPYSAPDWEGLAGLSATGLPIRLRLHVNAAGQVDALQVLQAAPEDRELVEGISRLLRQTRYAPARLNGQDVPSCSDLEIQSSAALQG